MAWITRQVDAFRAIKAEKWGSVHLLRTWRGYYHPPETAKGTIPMRVWERLLELGDLEITEGWGTNAVMLTITDQGRDRIRREDGEA